MAAIDLRGRWLALLLAVPLIGAAGSARADEIDNRLRALESEAAELGTNLPKIGLAAAAPPRRLVDAQVAFTLGDYDTAALMLFELAAKPGAEQETARFYLAEALYAKRDRGAARGYYAQVVAGNDTAGRYYQPALLRLVEIAIAQNDFDEVEVQITALDRLGTNQSVEATYIRGKLAFAQGKHDEAIATFARVPAGSAFELQAVYFTATAHVAKAALPRATEIFTDLIARRPRTANDRRVIELSQMALGRVYYERDQFAKSIDSYLLVDRHSDLFPDALYEVGWVYVKNKQFDKALRALELLALSEPTSTKTPTVRLLEGNLRIRKAQLLRARIVEGTIRPDDEDAARTPEGEYEKASVIFAETHDTFHPSYVALAALVDGDADPTQYLAQIAGKSPEIFESAPPLPESAAAYLAEEPGVQRAVRVEGDLQEIRTSIAQAEATLARLEALVATGDHTAVYPALSSRRNRIGQIQDDLSQLRGQLNDQQVTLVGAPGELGQLTAARRALAQQYAARPAVEVAIQTSVETTRAELTGVEDTASEASMALDTTHAMAVAIRTYVATLSTDPATSLDAEQTVAVTDTLTATQTEGAAIAAELAAIARELQLGRDLAAAGDEEIARSRAIRGELVRTLSTEHRVLAGAIGGNDKARKLNALGARATSIADGLAQLEQTLNGMADRGLMETRTAVAQERTAIAELRTELTEVETELRSLGSTVLGSSFANVKARFYDIVVRSDVGTVDVSWSRKEDSDDDYKRLNLSRQRELKQLRDEFKSILEESFDLGTGGGTPAPAQAPSADPTPAPPAGSPDSGAPASRVAPGEGTTPATPTVRPDNETLKPGSK